MISLHSCTCSTTSPVPGGNSTCGSTVYPWGGPAIRQAGVVYRNKPARRKFTQANLDITFARPNWTKTAFLAALKPNQYQL